ncbi:MAG: hypothetical protein ACI4HI_18580 [Lachnospiraceae bacterium]
MDMKNFWIGYPKTWLATLVLWMSITKNVDVSEDGRLVFRVSGDISEVLEVEDDLLDELKHMIAEAGTNALNDFFGREVEFSTDEERNSAMDDVLDQMPDEDIFQFCRKYLK